MTTRSSTTYALAEIWTEGKTDWKILKKAFEVLKPSIDLSFHETEKERGEDKLFTSLEIFAEKDNIAPIIFIFDHDNPEIVAKVDDPNKGYKEWGNNVYSFSLKNPPHRVEYQQISIEFYFTDEELHYKDQNGRSLFLTSEFNEKSGKFIADPMIHYAKKGHLKGNTEKAKAKIVDSEVYDAGDNNIALSKTDFADRVLTAEPPFDQVNLEPFRLIFESIERICNESRSKYNPYYPNLEDFFTKIETQDRTIQFFQAFEMFGNITRLGLYLFIASTIRAYEEEIINEKVEYKKKVTPIKTIITDAFRQPSLFSLVDLAQKCYYLIDEKAPKKLRQIKDTLNSTIQLLDIGSMWDDLDILFPQQYGTQKKRRNLIKEFLTDVLPDLSKIYSHNHEALEEGFLFLNEHPEFDIKVWEKAILQLIDLLSILFSCPLYFRTIKKLDPATNEYIFSVKVYKDGIIREYEEKNPRISDAYELKASELELGEKIYVHLYPFLLIKDDILYFYRRTLPTRYEYYSIFLDQIHIESTKAKFTSTIFKTGSEQGLFWTDVIPRENPKNGIKANIPEEGPGVFIGRRKYLNQIKDEIVGIVNENGIIFGIGGVVDP